MGQADERVRALILARNFGFQTALTCGMENADGDAVITMDGDLQHPPSLLPELIARWKRERKWSKPFARIQSAFRFSKK